MSTENMTRLGIVIVVFFITSVAVPATATEVIKSYTVDGRNQKTVEVINSKPIDVIYVPFGDLYFFYAEALEKDDTERLQYLSRYFLPAGKSLRGLSMMYFVDIDNLPGGEPGMKQFSRFLLLAPSSNLAQIYMRLGGKIVESSCEGIGLRQRKFIAKAGLSCE